MKLFELDTIGSGRYLNNILHNIYERSHQGTGSDNVEYLLMKAECDTDSSRRILDHTSKGNDESVTCWIRQGTGQTSNYTARNRQGVQIANQHKGRRQSYICDTRTDSDAVQSTTRVYHMDR